MKEIILDKILSKKSLDILVSIIIQLLNISNSACAQESSFASDTINEIHTSSENSLSRISNSLSIKSDSIFYNVTNSCGISVSIHQLLPKKEWEKLIDLLNIDYLKKVKSGSSNEGLDGSDVFTVVKTSKSTYGFMNGDQDTANYKYIKRFFDSIRRIEYYFGEINKIDSISEIGYSVDQRFSDTAISLKITADSIIFRSNSKSKKVAHFHEKISKNDWRSLTSSFHLNLGKNIFINQPGCNTYKSPISFYLKTADSFYLIRNPNKGMYKGISKILEKINPGIKYKTKESKIK